MTIHKVGNKSGKSLRSGLSVGKSIIVPSGDIIQTPQTSKLRRGLGRNVPASDAAGGTLWTPLEITTDLWLDSSDLSTITIDDSNRVGQWNDKSGNNHHLIQSTNANKPILTGGEIIFDGINDFLQTSSNFFLTGNPEFYAFFVYKKTTITKGGLFGWGVNNTLNAFAFFDNNTVMVFAYGNSNNFNVSTIANNTITTGCYIKTPGSINTTSAAYKNGTLWGTTGHSTNTPNITASPLYLGNAMPFGNYLEGVVYEFIVTRDRFNEKERQRMEGYLAHRWGTSSSLPNGHPYKDNVPIVN